MAIENPFADAVNTSYIKALIISSHTRSALLARQTEPGIDVLHAFYAPRHEALASAYTTWKAQGGTVQSRTLSLKLLLDALSATEIDNWDFAVQQLHRRGTATHTTLFPRGRRPFQRGTQESRIKAVAALATTLAAYPGLAALHTQVEDFSQQLEAARSARIAAGFDRKTASRAVEKAANDCAAGLFYVYGGLVQKFFETPAYIDNFFDEQAIRDRQQRTFTRKLKPGAIRNIARRTLDADAQIRIVNAGPTELRFFRAATKTAEPADDLSVPPGADMTVAASGLGSGPFLRVRNADASAAGAFELMIL